MKYNKHLLSAAAILFALVANAQTITLQPDGISGKDALVQISDNLANDGNTNYGSNTALKASRTSVSSLWYKTRGLVQFDLSILPKNAIITSATLTLSGTAHAYTSTNAGLLQRVTAQWEESAVTWNNQPAVTAAAQVSIAASSSSTQNYSFDVKVHLQDMVKNPAANFGWMIKLNGETTSATAEMFFASSDYTADVTKRPKLVITYMVLTATQVAATTATTSNGSVDLHITGGTAPYTYSWVNASGSVVATTQDLSAVLPGYYAVTVTDNDGKQASIYVALGSKSATAQAVVSIQPGPVLGNDAATSMYDNGNNVTANYEAYTFIHAYRWTSGGLWFKQRTYLSFDLSSIPPHAIITDAKLYLYGLDHSSNLSVTNASVLQRVSGPWSEAYLSWSSAPAVSATGEIALAATPTATQNYTLNVTSHVKDMVHSPETNFGWSLKLNNDAATTTNRMVFASSDYTTDATKRPKLEISFYIPENEEVRNWATVETFDNNGNIMSQTRSYVDALGRSTQNQTLDIENSNVLATQNVFDAFGRPVLQSLAAPLFQGGIYHKDGFIKDASGNNYSYDDFDKSITSSNLSGEVNNPGAVNASTQGSLGWYYSNNNTAEAYVPASSFPYNRVEYYNDPTGRVKRTASAGENQRTGSGNENEVFYLSNAGELYYVFGYRGSAIIGNSSNDYSVNENLHGYKTITVDPDGKTTVRYTTSSGLPIATCRSGLSSTCVAQKVSQAMIYYGPRGTDIHLPAAKKGTLRLTYGNAGTYGINEHDSNNPIQINYKIYDLRKEKLLVSGTDYTINRVSRYVTFLNEYATGDGFFRISFEYTSTYLSERFDPNYDTELQQFVPAFIPNLAVEYELEYSEWAINFFNPKGQLVKSVQPQAIGCTYNPITYNSWSGESGNWEIEVANTGEYTDNMETPAVTNFDQDMYINVLLNFRGCSSTESGTELVRAMSPTSTQLDLKFMSVDVTFDTIISPSSISASYANNRSNINYGTWIESVLDPLNPCEPPWPNGEPNGIYGDTRYYLNMEFELMGTVGSTNVVISSGHKIVDSPFEGSRQTELNLFQAVDDGTTTYSELGVRISAVNVDIYTYNEELGGYDPVPSTVAFNPLDQNHTNMLCYYDVAIGTAVNKYPDAEHPWEFTEPLVTSITYNKLDRPIKTISSDEGSSNIIYDDEGKIRFTQTFLQSGSGKFNYLAYDRAGRVVESGEYNPAIYAGSTALEFVPYNTDGTTPSYSGSGISVHTIINTLGWSYSDRSTQQTYTAYDAVQSDFPGTLTGYGQTYKDGRIAKSWNDKGKIWYGYDHLGRATWSVNDITGLGVKTVNYTYTKESLLEKLDYQKEVSGERFVHQYIYDANHRLKEAKTSLDNITFNTNQALKYYLHGAMKRSELGGTLQGLDYVYTINGWLKSMNDPTLSNRDPGKDSYTGTNSSFRQDVFGFTLDYFTGDYTRSGSYIETYTPVTGVNTALPESHTGLIRGFRWKTTLPSAAPTPAFSNELQFVYKYDNKNQLSEAIFGTVTASLLNTDNGLTATTGFGQDYNEQADAYRVNNITYDKNGNLKTMKSQGYTSLLSRDDFTYVYDATKKNRLLSITDNGTNQNYTDDIDNQSANNYEYNLAGQLTKEVNKDYNYTYNLAGKVTSIKKTNGNFVLAIEYNSSGQRQRKITYNSSGVNTGYTWYVYDAGGMLLSTYNTVILGSTTQSELQVYGQGRVGVYLRTGSYNVTNYVYELNDHLGNVRATIRNNAGNTEVLSYSDYYPHGSTLPGRNYISATAYDYAYQGQEKDTETGYLNFDLRQYDPRIGRWFNPDPMYQHHSPYLAMGNNPISSIDPTGGTDYYVDGYLVSGLEADATMNGGNVDVSTGGLAIGTTIGYSYGDKNYYGSHGAENADAARKEAYKQFFKTMNWNLKGGTYSTSGYFYSDHEGFDDKIGGQAWAGMDFDDVAGWYNLATGATMSNVRKAWQWDDERPSSAWGYCYTQEECETGALIVGGAAVGVLAAPIVASYAALGAAWAGEQALTGAAYLTFKAQVLTGTVSGAGAGGILLGRNMPEVMKIASQSGLGYLKMPGFIANSNNFRAMATYNGLWLNYHLQSGTQVNMLLNAAKNSYAPSGFMKLEFIILRGFYGK